MDLELEIVKVTEDFPKHTCWEIQSKRTQMFYNDGKNQHLILILILVIKVKMDDNLI